jgi:hypothetical protein
MSVVLKLKTFTMKKKKDWSIKLFGLRQDVAPIMVVEIRGTWRFCKPHEGVV